MNAEYITHYGTDLSAVNAARVSMNKESDWEYDNEWNATLECYTQCSEPKLSTKDEKLIHFLAKNKHTSCFEHQGVTLRLKVPLFVRSQIHRHRTFSYNEISRRYVKDDLEFYWPDKWRKAADNVKQGSSNGAVDSILYPKKSLTDRPQTKFTMKTMEQTWQLYLLHQYEMLLENGVCSEQARMILPQNLYTQFYMTGNLRNWAHFLKLRLDPHAQREVQEVAKMAADIIQPLFPVSYKALMENE